MSAVIEKIGLPLARRIALAAQGFNRPRPKGTVTRRLLNQTIQQLGLLQIDSVNVLTRMHYLPLFSRLGDYPRTLLEEAAWGAPSKRKLFEYWAHEASLLPLSAQPLLRWRMARAERGEGAWNRMKPFAVERRVEAETLLNRIEADGPLAVSDLEDARGAGGWWGWSDTKTALEWLFWSGRITTKTRRANFERVYDLTDRVLPETTLASPTPEPRDAHRALIAIAAKALGVATIKDLRDYFRLSPEDAKLCIPELIETGELLPVQIEGWSQAAFIHADAARPRTATAHTLLAPFDPLIWERSRTERLFGLRYRIEIYTPAHKREHGYYVLPFLQGDQITARVDLKSDRVASTLRVQAAHREPGASAETADRLANDLQDMAGWLGLARVEVMPVGALAEDLTIALRG